MSEWLPIEAAPKEGKFIALYNEDQVMTVTRYNAPFSDVHNAVIHRPSGKWFTPRYWIPLPNNNTK